MVKDLQLKNETKCEICRGGHATSDCPISIPHTSKQKVDFVSYRNQGSNAFGNSYNADYMNNPGFSWRDREPNGYRQNLFQEAGTSIGPAVDAGTGGASGAKKSTMEEMMEKQMSMMVQFMCQQNSTNRDNQTKFAEHSAMMQYQGPQFRA